MLNNIYLVKIMVLIYINFNLYLQGESLINIIVCSLIYIIIINVRLFLSKEYTKYLYFLEAIVTLVMSFAFNSFNIVLLAILIMEVGFFFIKNELIAFIVPVLLVIICYEKNIILHSIILTLLSFIIMRNLFKNVLKFNILINTIEKQRKQISHIEDKLKEEQSIREQFLYTTKLEEINNVTDTLIQKFGQIVSSTIFQMDAIKVMINQDAEGSKEILNRSIKKLKDGNEEIKSILKIIKPTTGELSINRLKLLLEEITKNSSITFKVEFTGNLDLIIRERWDIIMSSVKELSTNSVLYSRGDEIIVYIAVLQDNIRLEVSDNGIGTINIIKGNGLITLEEKIYELKGKVIFKDDNGFSVVILIPINNRKTTE